MDFDKRDFDKRIQELGLELPPAAKPSGVYRTVVLVDSLAYVSGHGPLCADGSLLQGRVGDEVDQQAGFQAARQTGLAMLATLKAELGSLDRVRRVVKLFGMVNSTTDFSDHPLVINGCSELFRDVFGQEAGIGARSAVGMSSLPAGITTEIEAIFEIRP